jgi:hypothetical protein
MEMLFIIHFENCHHLIYFAQKKNSFVQVWYFTLRKKHELHYKSQNNVQMKKHLLLRRIK